jgi:hypothetical protein
MPKLPAVKPREIVKFLERNGFLLDHISGSHHVYYHPTSNVEQLFPIITASFQRAPLCHCSGRQGSHEKH